MELFESLQSHVIEEIIMGPDGTLKEVDKVVVDRCGQCERLILKEPGHDDG